MRIVDPTILPKNRGFIMLGDFRVSVISLGRMFGVNPARLLDPYMNSKTATRVM
jgi:hypothetical protein